MKRAAGTFALFLLAISTSGATAAQEVDLSTGARETVALASDSIRGIVYLDLSSNGVRDLDDPPVAGALVSNQREVTVTDGSGRWALPAYPEMVTFVTAPRGYRVPVDSLNLPQFYHVHRPTGSPRLRFEGVAPTGQLPEVIEFPLELAPASSNGLVRAAMLADPQTANDSELSWSRDRILAPLSAEKEVDVAFVLGDIMNDNLALFPRYIRLNAKTGIPTFHVVGNHDLNFDAPERRYATETFVRWFGPSWYSVRMDDVVFIALNNVFYEGKSYDERGKFRGHLGAEQLEWLEETLSHIPPRDRLVFMAHVPFSFFGSDNPGIMTDDVAELYKLLEQRPNVLFLAGHTHTTEHQILKRTDGWYGAEGTQHVNVTAASGGWWTGPIASDGIPMATQRDGGPHGYHLFEFQGGSYRERLVAQGPERDKQLRLSAPEAGAFVEALEREAISVNVFNAGAGTHVELRLDDGPWQPLAWAPGSDPFFVRQVERQSESFGGRLGRMQDRMMQFSTHRWTGQPLGVLLRALGRDPSQPGVVRVEVRATRPDGSVYREVTLRELGLGANAVERN